MQKANLAEQFQRRFLEIDQPETRIAYGSHVCKRIRTKLANFIEYLPYMLPPTHNRKKIMQQ
jgi:hypothetical protein